MSLEQNAPNQKKEENTPKEEGLYVGVEQVEINKGRVQELMDNGTPKAKAMEIAKSEAIEESKTNKVKAPAQAPTEPTIQKKVVFNNDKPFESSPERIQELMEEGYSEGRAEDTAKREALEAYLAKMEASTEALAQKEKDKNAIVNDIDNVLAKAKQNREKRESNGEKTVAEDVQDQVQEIKDARAAKNKTEGGMTQEGATQEKKPAATSAEAEKSNNEVPPLKLEGETLSINGKTYKIEGVTEDAQGNKTYKARNMQPGLSDAEKIETFNEQTVRNSAEERREEMWADYKIRFNFDDEDIKNLEKNPAYEKLSLGQRQFVLQTLTSATLEKVDEIAAEKFEANRQKKGIFGKLGDGIFKHTRMTKAKTEVFKDMRAGGVEKFEDDLGAIISRVAIMGVPMIENEKGEVEVQYSSQFGEYVKKTPEAEHAQRAYDQAATAFQKIPPHWETPTASWKQQAQAKKAREVYEAARQGYFNNYGPKKAKKEYPNFLAESNLVDSKIELNRMMNANPENERVINDLYKSNDHKPLNWLGDIKHDLVNRDQKGYYVAGGFAARSLAKGFDWLHLGLTTTLAGAVGGIRGYSKARQQVRDEEMTLRRGGTKEIKDKKTGALLREEQMYRVETKTEDAKHSSYIDKMNDIIRNMEKADSEGRPQDAAFYKTMLDNRMNHALDRASKGKMTFGNKDVRIGNQAAFVAAISRAKAYSGAADPVALENWSGRLNHLMGRVKTANTVEDKRKRDEQKKFVLTNTLKSAAIGATLGAAGYMARDVVARLNEAGAFDGWFSDAPHADSGDLSDNSFAPDKTYVDMDDPQPVVWADDDQTKVIPIPGGGSAREAIAINDDAYIRKGEGIEHALRRQIENNPDLAKSLGWKEGDDIRKFSGPAAHKLAIKDGYIDQATGKESRVKWLGDKQVFYEVKVHSDGEIHVDEGRGTQYTENEAFDKNDRYSMFERQQQHGQDYEYLHQNGKEVHTINHKDLVGPADGTDKGVEYEKNVAKVKPIAVVGVPGENEVQPLAARSHPGKSLTGAGEEEARGPRGKRVNRSSVSSSRSESNVSVGNREHSPNSRLRYGGQNGVNQGEYVVDQNGLKRSVRNGTFIRTVKVHGQEFSYDTNSTNEVNAFDGKVNRNYNKLLKNVFPSGEDNFGNENVDDKVEKMLKTRMAEDDINGKAAPGADLNTQHYYNVIKKVHLESGLEPREGQPTGAYLKEALQKMHNEDIKINKFVNQVVKDEEAIGVTKVKKVAKDDVYN